MSLTWQVYKTIVFNLPDQQREEKWCFVHDFMIVVTSQLSGFKQI